MTGFRRLESIDRIPATRVRRPDARDGSPVRYVCDFKILLENRNRGKNGTKIYNTLRDPKDLTKGAAIRTPQSTFFTPHSLYTLFLIFLILILLCSPHLNT